jgi:putative ABC transport system permease protein
VGNNQQPYKISILIKNYFKTAIRNLTRNKVYAAINIAGIAIGLTAFWMIALYVADEFSYDRFHTNADRIYRVAQHASWEGGNISQATTSAPFAASLKETYPEIQEATRILMEGGGVISYNDKHIKADDILFADDNVFKVFSLPFISGTPATALTQPQSIALTESLARTLFGDPQQALHQTIYFSNNFPNVVTGVIKDIPGNSHLRFSGLRSLPAGWTDGWQNFSVFTYLLLQPGTDYRRLEAKLPDWAAR